MGFAGGKSDGITTKKVDFTDLMNYKMEQGAYKPKLYCTITPGVYFKYFMAGCGIGFMNLSGDLITSESNSELDTNTGQLLSSVSSVTTQSDTKFKFMIRPTIKGYIPCSEDFSIAVSLAYDLAFNYTEMNGLSFGLGFQYRFNW